MTRILITGVRGKTGAPLAELLAARPDVEVLGGSSDPSTVSTDGVRPVAFSWDQPAGWPAATDGVDAVYVVRPDRRDAPERIAELVAGTPPAAHVVLLSEQAAESLAPDGWAVRAERAVHQGGRSWSVVRPNWFMQVFTDPRYYRDPILAGSLPFSSGGAAVAWIDARDIAAVVERTLLEPGHTGKTYELSGPEALTLPQTAELLVHRARSARRPRGADHRGVGGRPGGIRASAGGDDDGAHPRRRLRRRDRHRRAGDRPAGPYARGVPGRLVGAVRSGGPVSTGSSGRRGPGCGRTG